MNIRPIKLLRGTHADTGQTGQGCFMNVIAYLNGEARITEPTQQHIERARALIALASQEAEAYS